MATNKHNVNTVKDNLFMLAGMEETKTPYDWDDMPEFVQNDKQPYAEMTIRFRSEEDLREFAEMIEQNNLSKRTKALWYPALDRTENSLLRFMEDND
jgi:hypothetical protein